MSTSESSFDLLSKEDLLAVKLSGIFTRMEVPILRELATLLYETFGGNSLDVKLEELTTPQSTLETVTTALSSFQSLLGDLSEVRDSLLTILTKYNEILQSSYKIKEDGLLGPAAQESSDYIEVTGRIRIYKDKIINHDWKNNLITEFNHLRVDMFNEFEKKVMELFDDHDTHIKEASEFKRRLVRDNPQA